MRFDYTKTINEQLPTFEYYKNRYASYELQIMELQEENKQLREKYKATNKGLIKVLSKRLKWKRRYYKEKYIRKELKKWLEEEHKRNISWYGSLTHHDKQYYLYKFRTTKDVLDNVQDKIKELEEGVK